MKLFKIFSKKKIFNFMKKVRIEKANYIYNMEMT